MQVELFTRDLLYVLRRYLRSLTILRTYNTYINTKTSIQILLKNPSVKSCVFGIFFGEKLLRDGHAETQPCNKCHAQTDQNK